MNCECGHKHSAHIHRQRWWQPARRVLGSCREPACLCGFWRIQPAVVVN